MRRSGKYCEISTFHRRLRGGLHVASYQVDSWLRCYGCHFEIPRDYISSYVTAHRTRAARETSIGELSVMQLNMHNHVIICDRTSERSCQRNFTWGAFCKATEHAQPWRFWAAGLSMFGASKDPSYCRYIFCPKRKTQTCAFHISS